jgi:beta-glucosidase-like glycosyl hydrolase
LDDAGAQLTARQCPAIPELGLPSFYWGTNALHSIREVSCQDGRCPTAFPIPPHYGASFNMSLVKDIGQSFGRELRGYYNSQYHNGLDTWSPTINIVRDPRWGRCGSS